MRKFGGLKVSASVKAGALTSNRCEILQDV
jgi:hypothetical protein